MKTKLFILFFCLTFLSFSQEKDPWTADELMKTDELAQKINQQQTDDFHLIHIGFEDVIPHSVDAGPGMEKESLENLREILKDVDKEDNVILYCGCCPMDVCPNIRPAFDLVKNLGYKNLKLLDIPTSIKADWIDYDYPVK